MTEEKALFENSLNFTVPDDSDLCPECKENQRRAIENETRRYFICKECLKRKYPDKEDLNDTN